MKDYSKEFFKAFPGAKIEDYEKWIGYNLPRLYLGLSVEEFIEKNGIDLALKLLQKHIDDQYNR